MPIRPTRQHAAPCPRRRAVPRARSAMAGLAAAGMAALCALPAPAQSIAAAGGRIEARHGAWTVMCDTPPGAPSEQCGALQEVVSQERPDLGLTVLVFETADGAARVLRVVAPLGVFLPRGLGLNIDGEDLGRAVFVRCMREGCQAEVVMDDALVGRLSEGTNATFVIFQSPDTGTGFPLELEGFADAFEAARADGAVADDPAVEDPAVEDPADNGPAEDGAAEDSAPGDGAADNGAAEDCAADDGAAGDGAPGDAD